MFAASIAGKVEGLREDRGFPKFVLVFVAGGAAAGAFIGLSRCP
jgi:hypothetical protein